MRQSLDDRGTVDSETHPLPYPRLDSRTAQEVASLSELERNALHEVDLGIERLHRAHGHLVAFHHNTGRGMNHLYASETMLRECGHERLANALRDDYLPRGVIPARESDEAEYGTWSYAIVEGFQAGFLNDVMAFCDRVHDRLANGLRHINERKQEIEWKRRARSDYRDG